MCFSLREDQASENQESKVQESQNQESCRLRITGMRTRSMSV